MEKMEESNKCKRSAKVMPLIQFIRAHAVFGSIRSVAALRHSGFVIRGLATVVDVDLANASVNIYEMAIERFRSGRKPHLYRHGAQRLIKSTEDMITLYDRMLYDLLFRVSYTFRVGHWLRKLRSNPEMFKTKLLERFSHRV